MRLEMKLLAFEPGMPKFRSIRIPLIRMPIPKDRAEHGGDSAPPVKAADIEAQRRKHRPGVTESWKCDIKSYRAFPAVSRCTWWFT